MKYKNYSLKKAADEIINKRLKEQQALGGVIGIDKFGNIVSIFNTQGMFRGSKVSNEETLIEFY